jgi:hypothetical protein
MSDAFWVALFGAVTTVLCRWMSNREHKKTEKKVAEVYKAVNGKNPPTDEPKK